MEALSRLVLYQRMLNSRLYDDAKTKYLSINIKILSGIEQLFLSLDDSPESKDEKDPKILEVMNNNISDVVDTWGGEAEVDKMVRKLEKTAGEYKGKNEVEHQNSRNLFNKIIRILGDFNDKPLSSGQMPVKNRDKGKMPQVFLTHAYDDKLYAFALFEYFYNKGIYLYVDWMHRGEIKDGKELKRALSYEIDQSDQLLFLRTINSELDIQGKQMLRSWCAWELGNFYRKNGGQKYLVNLYSVDSYYNDTNVQIHGLKLYTGVNNGKLTGVEIKP